MITPGDRTMPATRRHLLATAGALPLLGLRGGRAVAREPGHLVMGISGWPSTLAQWTNAGTVAQNAKLLMFRGLLGYGPDGQMRGELAERWERAEDGSWVFHLRDAVFHNGNPVTAADVRYSIEQMAADKSPAYLKGEMAGITAVDTPDARTVRLRTKEPSAVLPTLFASYFAPVVAKDSLDRGGLGVGAGPFVLAGQERGTFIDLQAFDRFYRPGLPKLRTVRLVSYADEDARVSALKAGDVDLIEYVPWAAMAGLGADPAFTLQTTEGPFMYLYFNAKAGPFSDARVRQAVAVAIRREEIVQAAFFGRGRPLESLPFERASPFFDEAASHGWAYDPNRAKALLAEAGLGSGFACKLLGTSTYGMIKGTAEVIQSQLAAIGIQAELVLPDWATRIAIGNRGQFDLAVNGTTNESNDPDGMGNLVASNLPSNYTRSFGISAPQIDGLLAEGRRTFDQAQRKAVYAELEQVALQVVPIVGLCWRDQGYAMTRQLTGFTGMPGALTFYSAMTLETASFG